MRREKLSDIVNRSINQTLSRTVLTSGLTFLTVFSYIFGGEVLQGFSFALVIGILIGTYSSIAIAAPMMVAYQYWRFCSDKPSAMLPTGGGSRRGGTREARLRRCPSRREVSPRQQLSCHLFICAR